jgi:ubiquitin-conjugating enzyme E2 Z
MATFISKETVNRLLKDVRHIIKNPLVDQGIYYTHSDTDMLKGYAMIVGPYQTPYFGGFYMFEFTYPNDYPHSPPRVNYCTNGNDIRFNPNLYKCGKVCVSLLNTWEGDQWTSCQTISSVLLTLCTLLCTDPLLNEPGVTKEHHDIKNYTEIIEYSNLNVAVCDIIMKKRGVYQPFFDIFYPSIKENFNKNYDKLLEFAQKKMAELGEKNVTFKTGFYNMNVTVNYSGIILKLNTAKQMLENI